MLTDELHLVSHEVLHVPVGFCLASVKNEILNGCFDSLFVICEFGELYFTQCLVMTSGHNGEACFIYFGQNIDFYTVNHIVGATVDDDTLYIGKSLQLCCGDVVRINLAINA